MQSIKKKNAYDVTAVKEMTSQIGAVIKTSAI
jgi:hypothetical protein